MSLIPCPVCLGIMSTLCSFCNPTPGEAKPDKKPPFGGKKAPPFQKKEAPPPEPKGDDKTEPGAVEGEKQ